MSQLNLSLDLKTVVKVNMIEYLLIAMDKSEMDRIMSINGSVVNSSVLLPKIVESPVVSSRHPRESV